VRSCSTLIRSAVRVGVLRTPTVEPLTSRSSLFLRFSVLYRYLRHLEPIQRHVNIARVGV